MALINAYQFLSRAKITSPTSAFSVPQADAGLCLADFLARTPPAEVFALHPFLRGPSAPAPAPPPPPSAPSGGVSTASTALVPGAEPAPPPSPLHPGTASSSHWDSWEGKLAVNLGAGLGLEAAVASLLGARVVATDGDESLLPLLRKCVGVYYKKGVKPAHFPSPLTERALFGWHGMASYPRIRCSLDGRGTVV